MSDFKAYLNSGVPLKLSLQMVLINLFLKTIPVAFCENGKKK